MKVHKATGAGGFAGFGAVLILALVLGVLFWRSFLPNYVHFSNDGPLGQQNNAASALPAGFLGAWYDNNDIGAPGGAWALAISALFRWAVGAVGYAKFLVPFALFILGLGAWSFFRQLKLSPLAVTLGTLAATLNSTFFATACWGVAPQEIAIGMDYFAMALIISITAETTLTVRLARLAMAGLCLGMNVMEAADIGAIFSLFVSAFMVANALNQEKGTVSTRLGQGIWQVAVVAIFAGFIACQTVVSLVGTQISGVAGTSQDSETKAEHWDWATQWSLPKTETLSLFVPGLYGYKMDTPANMAPEFAAHYNGGNYWGGMGRDPNWDRYYAGGSKGDQPQGMLRQTSGTDYCGILVVLVAVWAAAQSLRKQDPVFSNIQRRYVWFWSAVVILCVLFAWGRFSFFYALLYHLPYFSTIRSPTKFLIVFSWGIVVLFAYGIDGFSRRYLPPVEKPKPSPLVSSLSPLAAIPKVEEKSWWAKAGDFDRQWIWGCGVAVVLSLLGWLIFAGERKVFRHYLASVGFPSDPDSDLAGTIALFSIHQAGWFVLLIAVAAGLTILVISGKMAGRTKLTGLLLGLFLFVDMGRADLPYITYWNYIQKYDIDTKNAGQSTNPILNLLKDKYYEHRVATLPFGSPPEEGPDLFGQLYTIEWVQHQFPYYNIQTLDLFQRPRVAADIAAYEGAVYFHGTKESLPMLVREWQLTNTRYMLGDAGFLDALNSLDPLHRFRIIERFNVGSKEGIIQPTKLEEITALPDPNGRYALFEFSGALPRARLYSTWQVNTNDDSTLKTLASPYFDPAQVVLVSTPEPGLAVVATNADNGSVEFKSYAPEKISLAASTPAPAVLLYNSKYDSDWKVTVDGQPEPVLRCNYIMRGVYMSAGSHTVEFTYSLPRKPLYITLAAYGTGFLLGAFLLVSGIASHKKRE